MGQGFGKVLVLAKSRNRFRFIAVHGFYTFTLFPVCYVTYHPIASISFKLQWNFSISYQRPLVIENGLNIRLNKDVVHDSFIHALLVSRIAVSVPGSMPGGGGGHTHTLPIRVCAAQRRRDFEAPGLERGIHFRGDF